MYYLILRDLDFLTLTIIFCSKPKVILTVCRDILLAGGKSGSATSRCLLLLVVVAFLVTQTESSCCRLLLVVRITGGEGDTAGA